MSRPLQRFAGGQVCPRLLGEPTDSCALRIRWSPLRTFREKCLIRAAMWAKLGAAVITHRGARGRLICDVFPKSDLMKIKQLVASAAFAALVPSLAIGAPLLRYTFDEPSGNALDSGDAPASDGTLVGGATRSSDTPSGLGSSLDLRDTAPNYAHVRSGDAAKLDGLSALTLSTWLNLAAYPSTGDSNNARLISKQAASTFGGFNFSLNGTPNDGPVGADNFRVALFLGNNVSSGASDFGSAFANIDVDAASKWVMLAVTYDNSLASGNTKFYIGGVSTPVTQLGAEQTLPQLVVDAGTADFGVGFTNAAATADTSAQGLQDDVRVYGSVLDLAALEAVRLEGIVPEPGSMALLSLGLAGLMAGYRRA